MPLVDSHCHLNFPEFHADLEQVVARMLATQVSHALCICVSLEEFSGVRSIAHRFPNMWASVGVHPDHVGGIEPQVEELVKLAEDERVVGIGETGLDYYRQTGDLEWQRRRFRTHIRAARTARLPLIVHTREAAADTLEIMREEGASEVGGVMHCFTESWDVARRAIEMGFYISFSGIVTFRNAVQVQDVARRVPLDRLLVETDAPYLAPVPYRGKRNEPAFVRQVAECIATLKDTSIQLVEDISSRNFFTLFKKTLQKDYSIH
jgi:TatD DNase family protein